MRTTTNAGDERTKFGLLHLLLLLVSMAGAEVDLPTRAATCGVKHHNHFFYKQIHARDRENLQQVAHLMKRDDVVQIPVHWHLLKIDDTEVNGNIPLSRIQSLMQSLNAHHAGAGFSYFIASVEWIDMSATPNLFYLAPYSKPQFIQQVSNTYRKGNMRHLNLYVADLTTDNVGGMTTYPWVSSPTMLSTDWSLLDTWSVMEHPDYPSTYQDGLALTCSHETGHWMGLFHTFENGCDEPGDYVDDTNPEAAAYSSSSSTCSAQGVCAGAAAPIDNLMDYGSCRYQMSAGQNARMKEQFLLYRNFPIDETVITYQGLYGQPAGANTQPQPITQQQQPQTSNAAPSNNADQEAPSTNPPVSTSQKIASTTSTSVETSKTPSTTSETSSSSTVQLTSVNSQQTSKPATSQQAKTSQEETPTTQPTVETSTSDPTTADPTVTNTMQGDRPSTKAGATSSRTSDSTATAPTAAETVSVAATDGSGKTASALAKPEAREEGTDSQPSGASPLVVGFVALLPIVLLV